MAEQKKQYTAQEVRKILPSIRKFSSLADTLLGLLDSEIDQKKDEINSIKVLITDMKIPQEPNYSINIQAIDINDTRVSKKGKGKFNQKISWEDEVRKNNRGIIL